MAQQYTVRQGECVASIASAFGLRPQTLWEHPRNQELRRQRQNPAVLYPGDRLYVPDRHERQEFAATDQRHRFRAQTGSQTLRLRILDNNRPRAHEPCRLLIDGAVRPAATTDQDGVVTLAVPARARMGTLHVGTGEAVMTIQLRFGELDPITEESGVRKRLANLGLLLDPEQATADELAAALQVFQRAHQLPVTGVADDATRQQLAAAHCS